MRFLLLTLAILFSFPAYAEPFSCPYFFGRMNELGGASSYATARDGDVLYVADKNKLLIHDLTGKPSRELTLPGAPLRMQVKDGKVYMVTTVEGKENRAVVVVDINTGKVETISDEPGVQFVSRLESVEELRNRSLARPAIFDPYLDSVVYRTGTRKIHLVGKTTKEIMLPGELENFVLLRDGYAHVKLKEGASYFLHIPSGKQIPLTGFAGLKEPQINYVTKDHVYFSHAVEDKTVVSAFNLKDGKRTELVLEGLNDRNIRFSESGILYGKKVADYDVKVMFHDFKTGKSEEIGPTVKSYSFDYVNISPDQRRVTWSYVARDDGVEGKNSIVILDRVTGERKTLPLENNDFVMQMTLSADGTRLAAPVHSMDGALLQVWDLKSGAVQRLPLSDESSIRSMSFVNDNQTLLITGLVTPSKTIDLRDWSAFLAEAPKLRPRRAPLPEAARAGKLKLARDFPEMLEFFRAGKFKQDPELARYYLLHVLQESPNTYYGMLKDFPEIAAALKGSPFDISKLSPALKKRWLAATQELLQARLGNISSYGGTGKKLSDWDALIPVHPFLSSLPDDLKADAIAKIANAVAVGANSDPVMNGAFEPKLFKFIKQEVRTWFGETPKVLTDFSLVRREDQMVPLLLGTAPLDGDKSTLTAYGVYARAYPPIPIPAEGQAGTLLSEQSVSWKHNGQDYTAKFEIRTGKELSSLLPNEKTPDYAALWKDKKLSGLVVTGENLQDANPDLLNEYLAYYRAQGFRFAKPEPVKDMRAWIAEEIKSGRLDYMIKEAHTDGMENDLFRLFNKGSIQRGTRRTADGKEEVMHVFIPDPTDPKATTLIPNQEFGDWIRAREQTDQGPLVYFNTSCFGASKACHEYQAAASKKLVVVATTLSADTFVNAPESALRQLLTGFREGKSYEEMRAMMAKDPSYKAGESNLYLLPDDAGFDENIRSKLQRSVDTQLGVTGPDGKPYHLDTVE